MAGLRQDEHGDEGAGAKPKSAARQPLVCAGFRFGFGLQDVCGFRPGRVILPGSARALKLPVVQTLCLGADVEFLVAVMVVMMMVGARG